MVSFIESGLATRVEYEASGLATRGASTGSVIIRGMPVSANVIPAVLLAKTLGCGDMEMMNIMEGEHMTPEMLKLNPFHQMPNMSDGDFALAESSAIVRYIANKYGPEMHGGADLQKKATQDWAIEWCSTNFRADFLNLWYPTAGFGLPPEDQAVANAKSLENLGIFASHFLASGKFIGGASTPSIADYICATKFHMCAHPAVKARSGFEMPARILQYTSDFLAACPARDFLKMHDGFLASKME